MPTSELEPLDVENYTQGRLKKDDPETARVLAAAVGAARRYCGWHVTPVAVNDEIVVDGPGSSLLVLPTLRVSALHEVVEDGIEVAVDALSWSTRGLVRRKNRRRWTDELGGITVSLTHGFGDAQDWQAAVLSLCDRWAALPAGGELKAVGPFQYETRVEAGEAFTATERNILASYAIEVAP